MKGPNKLKEFVLNFLSSRTKIYLRSEEQKHKDGRGRPAIQVEEDLKNFGLKKARVEEILNNRELSKSSMKAIEKENKRLLKARNVAAAALTRLNKKQKEIEYIKLLTTIKKFCQKCQA